MKKYLKNHRNHFVALAILIAIVAGGLLIQSQVNQKRAKAAAGTWELQPSGTTGRLSGIYFVDDNTGWTVGQSGIILKTIDAGTSWIAQTSGFTTALYDISCIDSNTCWAVGGKESAPPFLGSLLILKTTDGGVNWIPLPGLASSVLAMTEVRFVDAVQGWAIGNLPLLVRLGVIVS